MNEEQCVSGEQIWVDDANEDVYRSQISLWFWASVGSSLGIAASLFIRMYAVAYGYVMLQHNVVVYSLIPYACVTLFCFVMAIFSTVRDRTS
jgi:hypothetical protein